MKRALFLRKGPSIFGFRFRDAESASPPSVFNCQRKAQELSFPADSYLVPFINSKGLPEKQKEKQ